MERQLTKRRRVYALEPSKITQAMFVKNYVSYLVPALMKINNKLSSEESNNCDLKSNVKYEVDMALVFSARGFAWSDGLKFKLQRDYFNIGRFHNPMSTDHHHLSPPLHHISTSSPRITSSIVIKNEADHGLVGHYDHQNALSTSVVFSSNPSFKSEVKKWTRRPKVLVTPRKRNLAAKEISEEEKIGSRLKNIRM
ncbi:transcription factor bHLH [Quillaja saponaria]|nr:transcription factor bHLH [Quillaja saponaria]